MAGDKSDSQRHEYLKRQRDRMLEEISEKRRQIAKDNEVKIGAQKFVTEEGSVENKLKLSTIGLVKLEEFQRIKGELEEERQREAAQTLIKEEAKKQKPKAHKRKAKKAIGTLSFGDDDEDGSEDVVVMKKKGKKVGKNPHVDTSFLPDKEREEQDAEMREQLRQEWLRQQELTKEEPIHVTYSYWDGSGHRKQVTCKKGDSIAQFLEKCRNQVPELRSSGVDSLVYVKEDLIIPHHYTFYDFIINKARGKSGPLFNFDVHDDVRLTHDARVEKDDSHAGKVCERSWYERNKHIFPANRWEVFDPEKSYGSYTIKDSKKKSGSR
ncbi:XAP5-domain-containing protein [Martensiomyces pterosporus]|nr:XAP5-domain-containing protein [Martensiomyces pterosporus]